MKRLFSLFLTICLFVWLMPLGAFIKPSQEKTACDGQRPFHMCCMLSGKVRTDADPLAKINFTNASNVNTSAKSAASGGEEFLPVVFRDNVSNITGKYFQTGSYFSYTAFFDLLDPPPKTSQLF